MAKYPNLNSTVQYKRKKYRVVKYYFGMPNGSIFLEPLDLSNPSIQVNLKDLDLVTSLSDKKEKA